jgi:phenylacetate-CoA ligase
MKLKSSLPGVAWPAVPTAQAAVLMALLRQYEESQWWSPEKLLSSQLEQLTILANHAARTVPFHAERLALAGFLPRRPMTPEIWRRLPVLTREDVRDGEKRLKASVYPPDFGGTSTASSGGSTGVPVRVLKTNVDGMMWQVAHLREFQWNDIDPGLEIANLRGATAFMNAIRKHPDALVHGRGVISPDWGPPATLLWETGKMGMLEPFDPIPDQAEFLISRRPSYLIMRPAGLRLLLCHFREQGLKLDSLKSVWTMSESVDESLRELCREIFGCPILSNYSTNETGYIGLQCPAGTNYHVVSESAFVEVVDAEGKACRPGEIGRVLVTPLHNFAMPLLRYQVGDEAEVGPPCACGRGLPTLTRIVGRLEDYVTLSSGVKRRVDIEHYKISEIRAVREFQLVQTSIERVELRLVTSRKLDHAEIERVGGVMRKSFDGYLEWGVVFVDSLPRTAAGKLRQFRSEV